MNMIQKLWHDLLGTHTVTTILTDFHAIVDRLEGHANRKEAEAEVNHSLADQHRDIADEHDAAAHVASAEADQARTAAANIAALVAK